MGCGAHLSEIVRTAVGEFTLDQAAKLEDLERAAKMGDLARYIIPLERLLPELPSVTILPLLEKRVRHGSKFNVQIAQILPGRTSAAQGATSELHLQAGGSPRACATSSASSSASSPLPKLLQVPRTLPARRGPRSFEALIRSWASESGEFRRANDLSPGICPGRRLPGLRAS